MMCVSAVGWAGYQIVVIGLQILLDAFNTPTLPRSGERRVNGGAAGIAYLEPSRALADGCWEANKEVVMLS